MKTNRTAVLAFCFCLFAASPVHAGILGDVDNDGKIGLPEAIYSLQVLSGAQTTLLPASFVIRWMGNWAAGQDYQKYDAVQYGGSSYIALLAHTSSNANKPPSLSTWNLMAGNLNVSMDAALFNTAVGISALSSNTTGNLNTAVGDRALLSNTEGYNNSASGKNALRDNTKGYYNTAIGANALRLNTEGFSNTANGAGALYSNIGSSTTGHSKTAMGSGALYSNIGGNFNTAIGSSALYDNNAGYGNIAVGSSALKDNSSGYHNTAVGVSAGEYGAEFTGSNNIYIGYNVSPGTATESDTIRIGRIGTNGQTNTHIAGIHGITITGGTAVYVNTNGRLGTVLSSRRYKQDIEEMGDASSNLMKLRPVAFHYRPEYADGPRTMQYGLIAEEVAEVYPELVVYDPETGRPQTVSYHLVNAMLLNEVQKQQRKISEQEKLTSALKKEVSFLNERLAKLEALLGR